MRLSSVFLTLIVLSATACDKDRDNSPKVQVLHSPTGYIPGGVGVAHTFKLVPAERPEVQLHEGLPYPVVPGRKPVKMLIKLAHLMDVKSASCEEGVCSVSYVQTALGDTEKPLIQYALIDEAGQPWVAANLTVEGQVPMIKPTPFMPSYGEAVKVSLPLVDERGAPLQFVPKLVNPVAQGGDLLTQSCDQEACTFEFLYNKHSEVPGFAFILEGPAWRSKQKITPQAEEVTYHPQKITVFDSPTTLRLVHGVDYVSSWKRPASQIQVHEYTGIDRPYFRCSAESCLSEVRVLHKEAASFTYEVAEKKGKKGRLDLTIIEPDVKPLLKSIVVDHDKEIEVALTPSVDYVSQGGALASALSFSSSGAYHHGLILKDPACDEQGVCRFKLRYNGQEPFVSTNYSLRVGNYTSPQQTLTISTRVHASRETIEFWDYRDVYQELVLRADQDYTTQDGSVATAILVKSQDILFRDVPELNDSNRNSIFQCDAEGSCRAWIRKRYSSAENTTLTYSVQTPSGTSAQVNRTIRFKKDDFKVLTADKVARVYGQALDEHADSVNFSLQHGLDYSSEFPAKNVHITVHGEGLVLKDAQHLEGRVWAVPCDEAGYCQVSGSFRADSGYLDVSLKLMHDRGESIGIKTRLIREQHSLMLPNLSSITLQPNGTEEFDVTLEPGAGKGYDGETLAQRIQVYAFNTKLLSNDKPEGATFLEYPCTAEGLCTFRLRGQYQGAPVKIRFLDAAGHSSILADLDVKFPLSLALAATASVPADVKQFTFPVSYPSRSATTRLIVDNHPGLTFSIAAESRGFRVTAQLEKPLGLDESLNLSYRIQQDGKDSNTARLTLKPFMPLTLKPDLVIPAKKEADGTWSVTLNYAEHFKALPISYHPYYYFDDYLDLNFENNLNIVPGTRSCSMTTNSCTWNFVKVQGTVLSQIKATLQPSKVSFLSGYHVKEGSLTIQLD